MRKGIIALLSIISVMATIAVVILDATRDKAAPVIQFTAQEITYVAGTDPEVLLSDVTATDNRDKDVSSSLVVENILPNEDGTQANVIYVAKDSSNNVAKAYRTVIYQAADGNTENNNPEILTEAGATPASAEIVTPTSEEPPTPEVTQAPASAETSDGEAANEAAIAELPEENPRIYLTTYALTIPRGTTVDRLTYVEGIEDNEDSRESIYQNIRIDGEVDTEQPGVYNLQYYVVDSDGNQSNVAVLQVTVE